MSINSVVLMGRITRSLELKKTQSGKSVVQFSIAVDRKYQKQGEERITDFFNLVAWGSTAELITKWFDKGDMIAVTGEIQSRNYEDKNGNKHTAVEIFVDTVSFCGSKAEKTQKNNASQVPLMPSNIGVDEDDDELPF